MTRVPSERRLVLLLATVFVVAFVLFGLSVLRWPLFPVVHSFDFADLVFWTALTLLVSSFPVVTPRGSVVSVSIAPILASAILGGPTAAAVVGFAGVLELRELRREIPWYGTLYNHCSTLIAAVLAGIAYAAVSGGNVGVWTSATLFAALIAGGVFFIVAELLAAASGRAASAQVNLSCRQ